MGRTNIYCSKRTGLFSAVKSTQEDTTQKNGICGRTNRLCGPWGHWSHWGHCVLCGSKMEGFLICGIQHCHCTEHSRGPLDELCDAEYWPAAVQVLRLPAGARS